MELPEGRCEDLPGNDQPKAKKKAGAKKTAKTDKKEAAAEAEPVKRPAGKKKARPKWEP